MGPPACLTTAYGGWAVGPPARFAATCGGGMGKISTLSLPRPRPEALPMYASALKSPCPFCLERGIAIALPELKMSLFQVKNPNRKLLVCYPEFPDGDGLLLSLNFLAMGCHIG